MQVAQQNNFTSTLLDHQNSINDYLSKYLETTRASYAKYGQYSEQSFAEFSSVALRGGKRIRGALVLESYKLHGGKDYENALILASAIEIIHAYLLVVDDFCDESETRRGMPSANKALETIHKENQWKGRSSHFGNSIAVNVALIGRELANSLILAMSIDPEIKVNILRNLAYSLIITGHGQINDIYNEVLPDVSDTMIENVVSWKTGYYSFYNPIEAGALLAKVNYEADSSLIQYSIALGNAFQIKDDIIGIYGDNTKTGKSNLDDIREGKMTILYKKGIELSSANDKKYLKQILGNSKINSTDLSKIKEIIVDCGALDETKKIIDHNISLAKKSLIKFQNNQNLSDESLYFLFNLCTLVAQRDN